MTGLRLLMHRLLSLPDATARPADQAAPTGAAPFLTVRKMFTQEVGRARRDFDGATETERIRKSAETSVSINVYGGNANALMEKLSVVFQSSEGIQGMKALKGHILRMSPVRNLSGFIGAGQEERAQMDIVISHEHKVDVGLKRIDQGDVTAGSGDGLAANTHIDQFTIITEHS